MQLQRIQNPWILLDSSLNSSSVLADRLFAARYDLRDDRKAIAGRSARENRPVPPPLFFEVTLFRDRHGGGMGPGLIGHSHVGSFLNLIGRTLRLIHSSSGGSLSLAHTDWFEGRWGPLRWLPWRLARPAPTLSLRV